MKRILLTIIAMVMFAGTAYAVNPQANRIDTDTTNFGGILNSSDTTVQKALDKVDNYTPPAPDLSSYWKSDGTSTATGNWDLGAHSLALSSINSGTTWVELNGTYNQFYLSAGVYNGKTYYSGYIPGGYGGYIYWSSATSSWIVSSTLGGGANWIRADPSVAGVYTRVPPDPPTNSTTTATTGYVWDIDSLGNFTTKLGAIDTDTLTVSNIYSHGVLSISSADGTLDSGYYGYDFYLSAGNGDYDNNVGSGGYAYLNGGTGFDTGHGGFLYLSGGDSLFGTGNGGRVYLTGGNCTVGSGLGGNVYIYGGISDYGISGKVFITGLVNFTGITGGIDFGSNTVTATAISTSSINIVMFEDEIVTYNDDVVMNF
jgi:hypothetical protein